MYNDLSYNSVANNIRAIKLTTKILSYFFFFLQLVKSLMGTADVFGINKVRRMMNVVTVGKHG